MTIITIVIFAWKTSDQSKIQDATACGPDKHCPDQFNASPHGSLTHNLEAHPIPKIISTSALKARRGSFRSFEQRPNPNIAILTRCRSVYAWDGCAQCRRVLPRTRATTFLVRDPPSSEGLLHHRFPICRDPLAPGYEMVLIPPHLQISKRQETRRRKEST